MADRKKMEGHCSTGQSPQWAVVPIEEEEKKLFSLFNTIFGGRLVWSGPVRSGPVPDQSVWDLWWIE